VESFVAPNLTPDRETGLGNWTDSETIRAIREGISKDGHVLHPTMLYPSYFYMSDVDVQALVDYLYTMPAIHNPLPRTELPPNVMKDIRGKPRPVRDPVPPANPSVAIRNSSKSQDTVLDPFGGSGTTMIACEKHGRQARLVELEPKYVDVVVQHWEQYTERKVTLAENGREFEQFAEDRAAIAS